jgi:hypothetical protein
MLDSPKTNKNIQGMIQNIPIGKNQKEKINCSSRNKKNFQKII